MLPVNPWEHQNAIKTFYSRYVEEVCEKHEITRMELDILLFLANNPMYDTASDIVEVRYLSKSQVSVSIKMLEQRGFLKKAYADHNRKTVHLKIMDADGQTAQQAFMAAIFKGIPQKDLDAMKRCTAQMMENIKKH